MVFQLDKVSGQKTEVEAARNGKDWGLTGGRQSGGRESKSSRVVPKSCRWKDSNERRWRISVIRPKVEDDGEVGIGDI